MSKFLCLHSLFTTLMEINIEYYITIVTPHHLMVQMKCRVLIALLYALLASLIVPCESMAMISFHHSKYDQTVQ